MSLRQQLTEDMKNAMRAHESLRLNTIRFLLSELKNWEIDNGEQDDAGILKIVAREVKKMKEAIEEFRKGDRMDLVTEEEQKVAVLEQYLPKQMSDNELRGKIEKVVADAPQKDFGSVMKLSMAAVQGQADGGRVSAIVKELLK